jgi:hypothetical protein
MSVRRNLRALGLLTKDSRARVRPRYSQKGEKDEEIAHGCCIGSDLYGVACVCGD